jgi:glycosyltransferase involved in cell wall biosynthesis
MRIGLLSTSFPRYEGDVAGHFVLGFARTLAARGHELVVIAPEPHERLAPPRWPGIDVRWLPYLRPRRLQRTFYGAGVPDNLRGDARAWLGLLPFSAALATAAQHELGNCDALVSHWALPCALAAGRAASGRPHLAVLHSADVHLLTRLPGRARLATRIARGASALWFVAETHRERFAAQLPALERARALEIACVQPMGIEEPAPLASPDRERVRRELGLTRFTLLTIARLVPVKGLVEAVQRLAHRCDLEWLIAGDGPEVARLALAASRAALGVQLLGVVTGGRKQALLNAADAFVLPSRRLASGRSEGVPTALLEAMAHGLPAIASDVGGIAAVARDGAAALLVDPDAPQALEHTIDRLRNDPALARGLSAAGRAEAGRHRWAAIGPRIETSLALAPGAP